MKEHRVAGILASFPVCSLPTSESYFRTSILRFLFSKAALTKGILSAQSEKDGGASKSEKMLVLGPKEAWRSPKMDKDFCALRFFKSLCVPFLLPVTSPHHVPLVNKRFLGSVNSLCTLFQTFRSSHTFYYSGLIETSLCKNKSTIFLRPDSPSY